MINGVAHGPDAGHRHLPAPHAALQGRRSDHDRALAGAAVPGHQGSRRGPERVRPHHPGRRVRLRQHGECARRQTRPGPQGRDAEQAMDAAACIGCGACVAACPNGSASLFTAAKIAHLGLLPQGQPERDRRARRHGAPDGRRGIRRLHPVRRMPGRLPEADQHRDHRPDESRLPAGSAYPPSSLERSRRRLTAGLPGGSLRGRRRHCAPASFVS